MSLSTKFASSFDPSEHGKQPSRLMSVPEAAAYMGISQSWLQKTRVHGGGPVATVIGRRVLYELADLRAWLATRKQASTRQKIGSLPDRKATSAA